MKQNALRMIPLAGLLAVAAFTSACQTASAGAGFVPANFSNVEAVKSANPDPLGGLFGREAIATVALAGIMGPNQAAFASTELGGNGF